jgi:hypothetical protein
MKTLFVAFCAMVTFSLAGLAQDQPDYLKRDAEYDGIRDNLAQDDWAPVKAESCTAYGVLRHLSRTRILCRHGRRRLPVSLEEWQRRRAFDLDRR